jgi:signal transduction histidine kinase
MWNLLNTFYAKLALALLASFCAIGIALVLLSQSLSNNYQDEVRQKLHLELAEHIAHDGDLIVNGQVDEAVLKQAFHNMMILGPDFEFYLLDQEGKVIAYSADPGKLKRQVVDLQPVRQFISGSQMLPILGDDPRSPNRRKIFSASEIVDDSGLVGYLYIIIGGEIYDGIVELLSESHIMQLGIWVVAAGLAFCLFAILLLFLFLTEPLRLLSRDIRQFRSRGLEGESLAMANWNENSGDEIQRIGVAFKEMAVELEQQYQKVKTTDELRKELLAYVSHDLRTPLASLQGYLETWQIKRSDLDERESERYIQIALDNATQINALVEQLFELAHLDAGEVKVQSEAFAIAELAQDVLQQFQLIADQKGVTLKVEPRDASILVQADIAKLERVLGNLVDNALRHCGESESVEIRFTKQGGEHAGEQVRVTVSDTGSGIDPADLPHIFSPHFRGKNPRSGDKIHSGLGLAITRRLLELHGTQIAVSSELGKGSVFWFDLPLGKYL